MTAAGPGTVELRSVTKRYGAHAAVDRVSLLVEDGTLVTLLGPSGCGKTTTLRIIAGLETPSEGQVLIGGRDVSDLPPADRNVSLVFQSYALFPHLSVLDNVAYGPRVQGARPAEAQGRAREALALLGLEGFEARLPSQLSGGQQQRVAVARALVLKPAVLLFDEPLSNLDARLRRRVRDEIRGLQRRLGVSVVYVTHDREEALAVSDRIIVMDQGRVAESGPPGELFAAPRTAFVADFLAEATLAAARLTGVAGELGEVDIAGHVVRVAHRGHRPGAGDGRHPARRRAGGRRRPRHHGPHPPCRVRRPRHRVHDRHRGRRAVRHLPRHRLPARPRRRGHGAARPRRRHHRRRRRRATQVPDPDVARNGGVRPLCNVAGGARGAGAGAGARGMRGCWD